MSNNTLTTERVRSSFIFAEEESPAHILPSVLGEEFDRWLAEVKADAYDKAISALTIGPAELLEIRGEAVKAERERIIALIEREWEGEAMATYPGCEWLIGLVKGETE